MRHEEKMEESVLECYRRMYREATPPINNFDKFVALGKGKKPDWFLKHYLNDER